MVVVRGKTQILAPGFRAYPAAIEVFIQQVVIKGVVAQQPFPGDPTLTQAHIADQSFILLRHPKLAPGEVIPLILQRHEPAAVATGKPAVIIHLQRDAGIAPRRQPVFQGLIHFTAHLVTDFRQRKHSRLLAGIQPVINHTGFTKGFRHFGKVLFALVILFRHAEVGKVILIIIERVFGLLDKR